VAHAGDGSGSLFVVGQEGRIRTLRGSAVLDQPFLDIRGQVSCCGERGLLSVAFPPEFSLRRHFYVFYTNTAGHAVVARFRLMDNEYRADPETQETMLSVAQPYANHNGGQLAFGPRDGYLYIGLGDGGSGGDPQNHAQNASSLLGKVLRIDVENGQRPYGIPHDNPYVGRSGYRPEIWALGLRNPWRFSFDGETGDLYVADVGQANWEEVNFQPSTSLGGENYGWRIMEGLHCYNPAQCDPAGLTLPVAEYGHDLGCSVTGGVVVRGLRYGDLAGTYLFGDYCTGRIWGLRAQGGSWAMISLLDTPFHIVSFGEDEAGGVLVVNYAGEVYRVLRRILLPIVLKQ